MHRRQNNETGVCDVSVLLGDSHEITLKMWEKMTTEATSATITRKSL